MLYDNQEGETLVEDLHTNIAPCSSSRIDGNDDTTLVSERESRRAVLYFNPAVRIGMVIGVQSEECGWLVQRRSSVSKDKLSASIRTFGTAGTRNDGEPLARLPNPALEPHMASDNSSSSTSSRVFLSLLNALVVENCSAREFIVEMRFDAR